MLIKRYKLKHIMALKKKKKEKPEAKLAWLEL